MLEERSAIAGGSRLADLEREAEELRRENVELVQENKAYEEELESARSKLKQLKLRKTAAQDLLVKGLELASVRTISSV
mgnify:CR=1 FL=1